MTMSYGQGKIIITLLEKILDILKPNTAESSGQDHDEIKQTLQAVLAQQEENARALQRLDRKITTSSNRPHRPSRRAPPLRAKYKS